MEEFIGNSRNTSSGEGKREMGKRIFIMYPFLHVTHKYVLVLLSKKNQ